MNIDPTIDNNFKIIQQSLNALAEELLCPVNLELLEDTGTLVPCCHKLSKIAAEQIFGPIDISGEISTLKGCPICSQQIKAWIKDESLQKIIKRFNSIPINTLNSVLNDAHKSSILMKLSSQHFFYELEKELICPISGQLLKNAVSLIPCCHKIDKIAAEQLLGPVDEDRKISTLKICPVCSNDIVGWMEDHTMQNFVNRFKSLPIGTLQKGLEEVKKTIEEQNLNKLSSSITTENDNISYLPASAFGKSDWESCFPLTIGEPPPLPAGLDDILEKADPWDEFKKVKETFTLYLVPDHVILHEKDYSYLSSFHKRKQKKPDVKKCRYDVTVENMPKIFSITKDKRPSIEYGFYHRYVYKLIGQTKIKAHWILLRNELIPGSLGKSNAEQEALLIGSSCEVPTTLDVIIAFGCARAKNETILYGKNLTRCQEETDDHKFVVGALGCDKKRLTIQAVDYDTKLIGLTASWKFT